MQKLLKPRIVQDITSARHTVFSFKPGRVNLTVKKWSCARYVSPQTTRTIKQIVVAAAAWGLLLGSALAPTTAHPPAIARAGTTSQEERQALEAQLQELENQINQYENQIQDYKKQGTTLKGEIMRANDKIAKLNLQIKAINITLTQLTTKINQTQSQIEITQDQIDSNKDALGRLVRNIAAADQDSMIEIFLKHPTLSDFFGNLHNISILQTSLRTTIGEITVLRDKLQDQREQLALAKSDTETARQIQTQQKSEAGQIKKEKDQLLQETKGQEAKYQDLLKKTKETAAQIRTRIFELLGGGELTFEQAYQYAKVASDATGVRPALILAILDRESALGRNVGRCSYLTAMSSDNQKVFLVILEDLDITPESVSVSCPNADGVYGGAMGPAQFLPTTWNIYKNQIGQITGHAKPSPWNNADAFVATGLYLKDAGAAKDEKIAAAKYYCGGRWNRYVCLNVYGRKVIEQAARFQSDIEEIIK